MERGLHADDTIDGRVGDRQPGGVCGDGRSRGLPEPFPARPQLPFGDVDRHQPARADHVGDHRILGTEPVPRIQDHTPGGQRGRERRHQPPARVPGLTLRTRPLPQPQVQPARRHGQEEVRPDALVHARGGIAALPEHCGGVPHMLACPSRAPRWLKCHPTSLDGAWVPGPAVSV